MDNVFLDRTLTHAVLSITGFIILFIFAVSIQSFHYEKAYRKPLLYLIVLGIFWSAFSFAVQLPLFSSGKIWLFNLASLFWVQFGFAILRLSSVLTMTRINSLWKLWNSIGILFVVVFSFFNKIYTGVEKEWYGYSAPGDIGQNAAVLLFVVPPILLSIDLIGKKMLLAKDNSKGILRVLFVSMVIGSILCFVLDVMLPAMNIFIYGESTFVITFLVTLIFCRTALVLSQYSMDIQQATRIVIQQLDEGVILVNEHGQVLLANPAACALLAVREVSMTGKNVLLYLPGITSLNVTENFPVHLGSASNSLTISVTMTPQSTYGTIRGYKLILRDISREASLKKNYTLLQEQFKEEKYNARMEITRIQNIIQEQEIFLTALLNNLPFRLWSKNSRGVYTKQNQLDLQFQGNRSGQTDTEITPEEALAMKGETLRFETNDTAHSENKKYYKNFLIPFYSSEQAQEGIIGISEDITELKLLEEERNQLKDHLQQTSKLEALNNLVGGIAHDFNNILGAQIGFCELAMETMPKAEGIERTQKYVEEILQTANRAKDLVQRILQYKTDRIYQKKENFSPALVLQEVMNLLTVTLPENIQIQTEIPHTPMQAYGDSTDLHRILINLGTNAIYAMKEKGGILTLGLREEHLEQENISNYAHIPAGNYLLMSVKDSGEGIPPNLLNRIFTPFFTTKPPNEGLGLGLAVTISLIQESNAYLTLDTAIGKGTNFYIYWPLGKTEKQEDD